MVGRLSLMIAYLTQNRHALNLEHALWFGVFGGQAHDLEKFGRYCLLK